MIRLADKSKTRHASGHSAERHLSESPAEPVIGPSVDRAAAMLPADLLSGGETIILLLKPSPLYIVLASLSSLAVLAAIIAGLAIAHEALDMYYISRRTLILTAIILASLRLGWQFFEWLSRVYVLTDRRVIRIRGVVQVEVFQAPLSRLQHTGLNFTFRERLFGLGTIALATAGSAYPEAYWVMLRRPIYVHQQILEAVDRYGGGGMKRMRERREEILEDRN